MLMFQDYLESGLWLILRTIFGMPMLLSIASYVLTALALYTIARRRGLRRPWLAWIPIADCWLLGSLSDQYRYVVKGEHKSKRKILLFFRILTAVMWISLIGLLVNLCFHAVGSVFWGTMSDERIFQILHQALNLLVVCLPLIGISIAYAVFRYMALYDIYKSLDPANCVLFLVLSILFGVTEPFFLFFSRNKDDGMPPRKQPVSDAPSSNDWVDVQEDEP
ncbi:MAG: hypothetical protein MR762_13000 [Clostridiales bacterium]|nr:hypothetical protein [Clostridiales bacterium]